MEIKFCRKNFDHRTNETMRKLKKESADNDVKISQETCLGYCGDCDGGPFAVIDKDEVVRAYTAEELYERLKDKI